MGEEERERDCNETEITAVSHQRLGAALNSESEDNPSGWDYVCMRECDTFGYVYNADAIFISQCVTCSLLRKLEKGCDGTVNH